MRVALRISTLALVCLALSATSSRAQQTPDPADTARFRLGVLRFTPSIAISNLGVDSNVFNEADNPRQDTTAGVGPAVDLWLKTGPARLSGKASGQYLYFAKYRNQRSWQSNLEGRWELPLDRIAPFISAGYSDNKDRPGYEIDSRVRLKQEQVHVGTPLRLSGKTSLVIQAGRSTSAYDQNDPTLGNQISQTLDRSSNTEDAELRISLTPLTVFSVRTEAQQDRFVFERNRNANSIRVMPGFDLKPEALISGQVFVGVRQFNALNGDIPDFTGVVADVSATYTVHSTQLQVRTSRDLAFSYEEFEPYYAQLDSGLTVTQRVTTRWDIVGRGGHQTLAYRHVATQPLAPRTDRSWQAGTGIGYRPTGSYRVGLDATYFRRVSGASVLRNYEGLRAGLSFSYGLGR
jgi:hypothetical protein